MPLGTPAALTKPVDPENHLPGPRGDTRSPVRFLTASGASTTRSPFIHFFFDGVAAEDCENLGDAKRCRLDHGYEQSDFLERLSCLWCLNAQTRHHAASGASDRDRGADDSDRELRVVGCIALLAHLVNLDS
jgi:hypothetical protein